jgi:histone demethylase JARID1
LVPEAARSEPRLSEIPDAPVFYPTEDEFRDPIAFVQRLRELGAEDIGICRIVAPKSWRPPKGSFLARNKTFPTRRQAIHRLQEAVGFGDGDTYTAREYKAQADSFYRSWFGNTKPDAYVPGWSFFARDKRWPLAGRL